MTTRDTVRIRRYLLVTVCQETVIDRVNLPPEWADMDVPDRDDWVTEYVAADFGEMVDEDYTDVIDCEPWKEVSRS
jgi:hypothetical protein